MISIIETGLSVLAAILVILAVILVYLEYKDEERNQNVLVGVVGVLGLAFFLMTINGVVSWLAHAKAEVAQVNAQELKSLKSENIQLSNKLKEALKLEDLNVLYKSHFQESELTSANYMDRMNSAFKLAAEYQIKQDDWAYNLYLLEQRLNSIPANIINTKVPNNEDFEYTTDLIRIQRVLKYLGYFDGIVTGDQQATYEALKKYQEFANAEFNSWFPKKDTLWTDPANYGFFGRGTLAKLQGHCSAKAQAEKEE